MLNQINTVWIGPPTQTPTALLYGHAERGPLAIAAALSPEDIRVVQFWCLDVYVTAFTELFSHQPRVHVCSIELYLADIRDKNIPILYSVEIQEQLSIWALNIKSYIDEILQDESNSVKDRVNIKKLCSLLVLSTQGGYYLDTNVEPLPDQSLPFPTYNTMALMFMNLLVFADYRDGLDQYSAEHVCYIQEGKLLYREPLQKTSIELSSCEALFNIVNAIEKSRVATLEEAAMVYSLLDDNDLKKQWFDIGVVYVNSESVISQKQVIRMLSEIIQYLQYLKNTYRDRQQIEFYNECPKMIRHIVRSVLEEEALTLLWAKPDSSFCAYDFSQLGIRKYYFNTHRYNENVKSQILVSIQNGYNDHLRDYVLYQSPNLSLSLLSKYKNIPLIYYAVMRKNYDACRILLDAGAQIKGKKYQIVRKYGDSLFYECETINVEDAILEQCLEDQELKDIFRGHIEFDKRQESYFSLLT